MNRTRVWIVLALCAAAMLTGGQLLRRALGGRGGVSGTRLFDQVLGHVERNFVDSLDADELYRRAASGMVEELHDPNSEVLDAKRASALTESTAGEYAGVGVQVDVRDGWLSVIATLPGGPAEQAGLRAGDRIVEVDSVAVTPRKADEARRGLRGKAGTKVALLVERPGVVQRIPITITRAAIRLSAVRHSLMLAPGVGYVQLAIFSDSSAVQLRHAIEALRGEGMRALLLDLRGDPGGLLTEGVEVADEFLARGDTVVSLRGRVASETRTITDVAAERWPGLILMVLTDGGSASASELVTGAWQDHDRAAVVGSTTYGKGSAQSIFPLEGDSGALRLTTALWYTPSGRSIQKRRRSADDSVTAADTMAEPPLASRKEYRTAAGRVVYGGGGITPDLIVAPQDSVDGETRLARALGKDLPRFRDLVVDEAAAARASGAVKGTVITVTPAMREQLWKLVQQHGLHLQRAQFDSAGAAVDRMLGDEIARDALGSDAAFRQRLDSDRVVAAALALASGATNEREVLQRAAERRASHNEDVPHAP